MKLKFRPFIYSISGMGMALMAALGLVAAIGLVGCSTDYQVNVRSDTDWSGSFGNRTVDGFGNKTIDLPDDPPVCVVVQKNTEYGFLEIQIESGGGGLLGPSNDYESVRTTAEFGLVDDCTHE